MAPMATVAARMGLVVEVTEAVMVAAVQGVAFEAAVQEVVTVVASKNRILGNLTSCTWRPSSGGTRTGTGRVEVAPVAVSLTTSGRNQCSPCHGRRFRTQTRPRHHRSHHP